VENNTKDKEKCFVIMPISDQGDYPKGHFTKVYEQIIKPAVENAGYIPYRVDENKISDTIINKIFDAIQECPMAICDLSNRNPNVLYELGLRQAYDKPVVLIQDNITENIFDVSGISTIYYQSDRLYENVLEAREKIKDAIISTKEGRINTLVRIVKASAPDLSGIDISPEDKLSAKLDLIYDELKKNKNENTGKQSIYKDKKDEEGFTYSFMVNADKVDEALKKYYLERNMRRNNLGKDEM
jgi:hypothetical protein